jgi:hypothetical protein
MGRKGEEDVFSNWFRQIDFLCTGQFDLTGEVVHVDRALEALEAIDALHGELHADCAGGEQSTVTETDVE